MAVSCCDILAEGEYRYAVAAPVAAGGRVVGLDVAHLARLFLGN